MGLDPLAAGGHHEEWRRTPRPKISRTASLSEAVHCFRGCEVGVWRDIKRLSTGGSLFPFSYFLNHDLGPTKPYAVKSVV